MADNDNLFIIIGFDEFELKEEQAEYLNYLLKERKINFQLEEFDNISISEIPSLEYKLENKVKYIIYLIG
jgi:hypothetical protein